MEPSPSTAPIITSTPLAHHFLSQPAPSLPPSSFVFPPPSSQTSPQRSSAPQPYQPPSYDDYPPSFSVSLNSPHHPAMLKLTATSYLPLRAWLPWLEWDGSWMESHPMQTVARCPIGMLSETVRILHEKGLKQTRHMLMARF